MVFTALATVASGLLAASSAALDATSASQLCLDSRIRKNAAELVGAWSENYPFARVIIGSDGKFGDVGIPSPAVIGPDFVVCGASFNLVKVGRDGVGYTVRMDRFYYRVTTTADGYRVSLEDLPPTLNGTAMTSRELIGRFKINGRPYADILAENQERLKRRR